MTMTLAVPAELFVPDPPRLLGSRCRSCGSPHFPPAEDCPYCSSAETEPLELSTEGRVWAWTSITAPPPGYRGAVPYGFGVVELPEGLRIVTRLTEADPQRLSAGARVRLVADVLYAAEDGRNVVTWAFSPA